MSTLSPLEALTMELGIAIPDNVQEFIDLCEGGDESGILIICGLTKSGLFGRQKRQELAHVPFTVPGGLPKRFGDIRHTRVTWHANVDALVDQWLVDAKGFNRQPLTEDVPGGDLIPVHVYPGDTMHINVTLRFNG